MPDPAPKKSRPTSISRYDGRSYESQLDTLIQRRQAEEAVEWYIHHPNEAFPHAFNQYAKGVDGQGIDRMYRNGKRVLARLIRDGEVCNGEHLHKLGIGILKCLGRHHSYLAWRRRHPTLAISTTATAGGEPFHMPLFVTGVDLDRFAVATAPPDEVARWNECLAALSPEARGIGLLHVEVIQAFRRYEFEFGKTSGAYVHLARLAVLDEAGRVVKLRSWRTKTDPTTRPSGTVIRRVRTLHLRACDLIRGAARRLGYTLPPGV